MRSIGQIYQEIVTYKDSQSAIQSLAPSADTEQQLLIDLNSTSKVAIWRLWAYIVAVAIYTHEALWVIFKGEVQAVADSAIVGTVPWYQGVVFKYQHGDALDYDSATGKYDYATDEPTLRIVKRCAVIEGQDGVLAFKVAKLSSGDPVALDVPEQTALVLYLKKVRFAGTRFTLLSGSGDIIRIPATIYYDGVVPLPTISANVQAAIKAYVAGLPFNGELLLSRLVDVIQAVEGTQDVVLGVVQTKTVPSDPYVTIVRFHVPLYGYYQIDTTPSNTLIDTLTFIAQ
jgi:hypothetical protein